MYAFEEIYVLFYFLSLLSLDLQVFESERTGQKRFIIIYILAA